jgi:hypothetical protein
VERNITARPGTHLLQRVAAPPAERPATATTTRRRAWTRERIVAEIERRTARRAEREQRVALARHMVDLYPKRCSRCGESRPRLRFYRDPRKRDGRRSACPPCERAYLIAWHAANPKAKAAHKKIENALKRGELVRPAACEVCGREGRLDAHHEDYARPRDVRFLCRGCHNRLTKCAERRVAA